MATKTQRDHGKAAQADAAASADDDKARSPLRLRRLFSAFDASQRPDRSIEGFKAAAKAAIDIGSRIGWESPDHMVERIEHEIAVHLRVKDPDRCDVYTGVRVHFVGCDLKTRTPQYRIETDWGWRVDIAGLISFQLVKPLGR